MAFNFRFNVDPATLGTVAEQGGRRGAVRENTIESLRAKQRRDMQAAENMMQLSAMAQQADQRAMDRAHDLNRLMYGNQADYARQQLAGDQQRTLYSERDAAARLAEKESFDRQMQAQKERDAFQVGAQRDRDQFQLEVNSEAQQREFNDKRLLGREEFIQKGLESGAFMFTPQQIAHRQKLYNDISALRIDRNLRPELRAQQEQKLIAEIERLEPMPVPPDQRRKAAHEAMNAGTLILGENGWEPVGQRPLKPGDKIRTPIGDGKFEESIHDAKRYESDLRIAEEAKKAEIARNAPLTRKEADERYASTREAISNELRMRGEEREPTADEINDRIDELDKNWARMNGRNGAANGQPAGSPASGAVQRLMGSLFTGDWTGGGDAVADPDVPTAGIERPLEPPIRVNSMEEAVAASVRMPRGTRIIVGNEVLIVE